MKKHEMNVVVVLVVSFLMTCIVNCQGPEGIQGVDGVQGNQGSAGADGSQGAQGPSGPAGSPGLNATPVTVVQLCPGATSYPGVFVEVALCINNKLYAVYSIPGSFLTLLPPGSYTSSGIHSACNLTVGPGCQVTH